jgi:L-malate glycosyltransferase
MEPLNGRVLMITPYANAQRGNSLTTRRLQRFLGMRGFQIDLFSLEDDAWPHLLRQALTQRNYSLIHGFHALHFGQVLQALPDLRQLPLVLTTTGTDIHYDLTGPDQDLVRETLQAVQKIVVFNEVFRRDLQSRFPELGDKLVTIPQGVFLETGTRKSRAEMGLKMDEVVILLPSGLRPVKNIDLAIDALSWLQPDYPQIRLLIIGAMIDEVYSRAILERIRELAWITYVGEIPHEEMGALMALGDIVLNTSHSEGQPQAALEAMSLGKPCILTAVSGNLNLIESGQEGFYVRNMQELAAATKILLDNRTLRKEMGQKARYLVETRFSLEQEIDAFSHLYQQILSQQR